MVRRASAPNLWRIEHLLDRITLRPADLLDQLSLITADRRRAAGRGLQPRGACRSCRRRWDQPMLTGEFNSQGVTRVLEAIRQVDPTIRFYQASSSEMFGKVREVPQTELTPFYPRSPYGVSKVFGHYITVNYRESYGLFAVLGHPVQPRVAAPRPRVRDPQGHRRRGAHQAGPGRRSCALGNLDARRDWGFAGDYVRAMWLMLQQDQPDDYVIATGEAHSVRELVEMAFGARRPRLAASTSRIDPALLRPAEVDHLIGDPAKARHGARLAADGGLRAAGAR